MLSLHDIHRYWRHPGDTNTPDKYAADDLSLTEALHAILRQHVTPESSLLELGCNCGRNMNYIWEHGYKNLTGMDINADSLDLMRQKYPNLNAANTYCGSIEDLIRAVADDSYDCVFTLAVLEHIHPESEWVFAEMVRITKRVIVTIEDEKGESWRIFPRDYKAVFEPLGMKEVYEMVTKDINVRDDQRLDVFVARVFEKVTE